MRRKINLTKWLLWTLFSMVTCVLTFAHTPTPESEPSDSTEIIYVDDDATGANVGTSWEYAMNSLQDALLLAYFLEKPVEIHVAQGYKSILSGDLEQNDGPDSTSIAENSYHVVTIFRTDQTAILDGLTITAGGNTDGSGRANDSEDNMGGGMYNNYGSPMLINCTFSENRGHDGAGVYNRSGSSSFIDCTFSGNSADEFGGGIFNYLSSTRLLNCAFIGNSANSEGGGMYNIDSSPVLTNCTFSENTAGNGAGMYNSESSPMLSDCAFHGNSTTESGGGIYNDNSNPMLLSCIFSENSAQEDGGGIVNIANSNPTLTNCTFIGNMATNGGAIDCSSSSPVIINNTIVNNIATEYGGGIYFGSTSSIVTNTILWNNSPNEMYENIPGRGRISSLTTVTYNNIKGGFPGEGNIDSDPLFADPDNGDYHLKSQAGRWDIIRQSWVIDQTSSLCIDGGDPNTPVGLERFPNGGRINIGVHGGTPEASLSPWQALGLLSKASNPYPADGALDIVIDWDMILSWTPGRNALWHDVYFGTDSNDVINANPYWTFAAGVYKGRQEPNEYQPGTLDYDQIYYWRIDEVDSEGRIVTGEVWTFTTRRPKGRACFTDRTPVWVNSARIPISMVASGQSINTLDDIGKVEEVQVHTGTFTCYDIMLESGNCITVAENHYFMTDSGQWLSLKNLKAGTRLKTSKDSIGIKSITKQPELYLGKVYNLKIEGSDRYLVGEDAVIVRDY